MSLSHNRSSSLVLSRPAWLAGALSVVVISSAWAQEPAQPPLVTPELGQPGKDVVWVPSPNETVAMMLDLARVTSDDYVIDLGSGDGRTVIAAALRGARALGVEYNPDLVAFSRQEAVRAGVVERARFVEGDMYEADVS
jgi:SAM-dependent methyltransferase